MEDYINSIDNMRFQVVNPCNTDLDAKDITLLTVNAYSNNVEEVTFTINDRKNCNQNKIIAWFIPKDNDDYDYNFGNNSYQVVSRVVGKFLLTEMRESSSNARFEPIRHITGASDSFGAAQKYCNTSYTTCYDCTETGDNCLGLSYNDFNVMTGASTANTTPIGDISRNKGLSDGKSGLDCPDSGNLFVEYGTEKLDEDGNIYSGCIVNTDDIYFLYIPCGHYTHAIEFNNNAPGYISTDAFSGLTNLKGLWIDGAGTNRYFSLNRNDNNNLDDPFGTCESLEIVYCPDNSNWITYFKDRTKFPSLKYINGVLQSNNP